MIIEFGCFLTELIKPTEYSSIRIILANKIISLVSSLIPELVKVISSISATMKQTTLKRFIAKSSSESDDEDEEYIDVGSKIRKSEIFYWTKVQSREQMGKKQHAVYSIGEDLTALRRNKLYTKQCRDAVSKIYRCMEI